MTYTSALMLSYTFNQLAILAASAAVTLKTLEASTVFLSLWFLAFTTLSICCFVQELREIIKPVPSSIYQELTSIVCEDEMSSVINKPCLQTALIPFPLSSQSLKVQTVSMIIHQQVQMNDLLAIQFIQKLFKTSNPITLNFCIQQLNATKKLEKHQHQQHPNQHELIDVVKVLGMLYSMYLAKDFDFSPQRLLKDHSSSDSSNLQPAKIAHSTICKVRDPPHQAELELSSKPDDHQLRTVKMQSKTLLRQSLSDRLLDCNADFKAIVFEPPQIHSASLLGRKKPFEYYLKPDLPHEELNELTYSEKYRRFNALQRGKDVNVSCNKHQQQQLNLNESTQYIDIDETSDDQLFSKIQLKSTVKVIQVDPDDSNAFIIPRFPRNIVELWKNVKNPAQKYIFNVNMQHEMQKFILKRNTKILNSYLGKIPGIMDVNALIELRRPWPKPIFISEQPQSTAQRSLHEPPIMEIYHEKNYGRNLHAKDNTRKTTNKRTISKHFIHNQSIKK